jgi:hypothetical protein
MNEQLQEEYRQAFRRLFSNQNLETTYCHFDGNSARIDFYRNGWNYAIKQGWLRVEEVEWEQETYFKGYLTEKGKREVLDDVKTSN